VISLVGDEQAIRIDQILHQVVPPLEYKRRQIQCGSSAQFQGDERDVMFLDVVDSSPENPPLDMRAEGYLGVFKKRFNVAASRARDQMWVVHSLNPLRDLKPGDIRLRLIRHVEDPNAIEVEIEQKQAQAESEFERQVIQALVEAGFDVLPQWKVGGYRIDMVVVSNDKKAAIECDGDRWHPSEKTAEDVARQALLERLGWKQFIRIRGSQYFRSPKDTIRSVIQRLGELGISPQDRNAGSAVKSTSELHERVIRRAAELARQWEEEGLESILAAPTKGRGRKRFTKVSRDHVVAGSADGQSSKQVQDTLGEPERDSKTGSDPEPPRAYVEPEASATRVVDKPRLALGVEPSVADPAAWLNDKGFEIIDKRQFGGNLWVIGGPEIEASLAELKKQGIKFYFKELGGKATGYRPAWFTMFGSIPQKRP
jgi:very-short-patch-repair endonuclease